MEESLINNDLADRINQMEPSPDEPAWLSLLIRDVVVADGEDLQDKIADLYYEIERTFESMVESLENHFGESDSDLEQEIPAELREGIKEAVFWSMTDEGYLMLGWIHESDEAPVEILAARVV